MLGERVEYSFVLIIMLWQWYPSCDVICSYYLWVFYFYRSGNHAIITRYVSTYLPTYFSFFYAWIYNIGRYVTYLSREVWYVWQGKFWGLQSGKRECAPSRTIFGCRNSINFNLKIWKKMDPWLASSNFKKTPSAVLPYCKPESSKRPLLQQMKMGSSEERTYV